MKLLNPKSSGRASGKHWDGIFYTYGKTNVVREFGKPSFPRTAKQIFVSSLMTTLSRVYADDLTEGQRNAWGVFASSFVWTGIWGEEKTLKSMALFQKINFPLIYSGRPLQLTPPPPVDPDVLVLENISNEEGDPNFKYSAPTVDQVEGQQIFYDVWFAGEVANFTIVQPVIEPPTMQLSIFSDGLPPGVNPVKSDFRHLVFATPQILAPAVVPPEFVIAFRTAADGEFTTPTRLMVIIRPFNKWGRYAPLIKTSIVSSVAP